jgi:hypothetical protein
MRKREKIAIIKRFVKSGEIHNTVELMNLAFGCKMYVRKTPVEYFTEYEYFRHKRIT